MTQQEYNDAMNRIFAGDVEGAKRQAFLRDYSNQAVPNQQIT